MTAASAAVSAVSVFREIFVARRIEQIDDAIPIRTASPSWHGNAALLLDFHPVRRRVAALFRAFTVPAIWIAPENSRGFSFSLVLPASGWEIVAKVGGGRLLVQRTW